MILAVAKILTVTKLTKTYSKKQKRKNYCSCRRLPGEIHLWVSLFRQKKQCICKVNIRSKY